MKFSCRLCAHFPRLKAQISPILPLLVVGVLMFGPTLAWAENLVPSGDFEDYALAGQWAPANVAGPTEEEHVTGASSLRLKQRGWITAPERVLIDPKQSYVLRAFIKEPSVKLNEKYCALGVQIGLRIYDENQEQIGPFAVAPIVGTDATLAQEASKGDNILHLKGPQWEKMSKRTVTAVAFDAKDDLTDLPNAHTAAIEEVTAGTDGSFEVHLHQPLEEDHPAGTRVRQHSYTDLPLVSVEPGLEWAEHDFEIGGESEAGIIERGRFWHGTRFISPTIIGSPISPDGPQDEIELLLDDVSFTRAN